MKTALRESIWLIAIAVVSALIYGLYLGNSAADIGMHDTYINVNGADSSLQSATAGVFVFAISFAFLVYLSRVLFGKFTNIPVNLIMIVITGIDIFYFSSNIIFYAEANANASTGIIVGSAPGFLIFYRVLKFVLILTLAITAYMTGRNWKRGHEKPNLFNKGI